MKKWILNRIPGHRFWLSWWPHVISAIFQCSSLAWNLSTPSKISDFLLFVNAVGFAVLFQGIYWFYGHKQREKMAHAAMSKMAADVLASVKPELDALMDRELGKQWENVTNESLQRVEEEAQKILDRAFNDFHRNRSSESTPDKP